MRILISISIGVCVYPIYTLINLLMCTGDRTNLLINVLTCPGDINKFGKVIVMLLYHYAKNLSENSEAKMSLSS